MKLEVGKYYKTRDGRKVGPMERFSADTMCSGRSIDLLWFNDGKRYDSSDSCRDLISEWTDTPTVGTLEEIGAQLGDVVRDQWGWTVELDQWMIDNFEADCYRIIRRAAPVGPVITETVTRKRIVPGVYGRISIHDNTCKDGKVLIRLADSAGDVNMDDDGHYMSRADLIAARDVLNQLIDALTPEQ